MVAESRRAPAGPAPWKRKTPRAVKAYDAPTPKTLSTTKSGHCPRESPGQVAVRQARPPSVERKRRSAGTFGSAVRPTSAVPSWRSAPTVKVRKGGDAVGVMTIDQWMPASSLRSTEVGVRRKRSTKVS